MVLRRWGCYLLDGTEADFDDAVDKEIVTFNWDETSLEQVRMRDFDLEMAKHEEFVERMGGESEETNRLKPSIEAGSNYNKDCRSNACARLTCTDGTLIVLVVYNQHNGYYPHAVTLKNQFGEENSTL
jgi:hypothetical protein